MPPSIAPIVDAIEYGQNAVTPRRATSLLKKYARRVQEAITCHLRADEMHAAADTHICRC